MPAPALVIEDGTGVVGANCYVDLDYVRTWASRTNITIPAADDDLRVFVYMGMDWFENHEFMGYRVYDNQELAFPRAGFKIDGIAQDGIPDLVRRCVAEASCVSVTINLEPNLEASADGQLRLRRVGPLERQWFRINSNTERLPVATKLSKMISPLIGGGFLKVYRA